MKFRAKPCEIEAVQQAVYFSKKLMMSKMKQCI